jgi:hypothetical protein
MAIKVPLKKEIILITTIGDILCSVEFAGKNILKLKDARRKIYTEDGDYFFAELETDDDLLSYIERDSVIGYSVKKSKKIIDNKNIIQQDKDKIVNIENYRK